MHRRPVAEDLPETGRTLAIELFWRKDLLPAPLRRSQFRASSIFARKNAGRKIPVTPVTDNGYDDGILKLCTEAQGTGY